MAYVTPTATDFRTRYPEFTAVGNATITAMIAEAEVDVNATWIENDRRPAVMALTAHWLFLEGEPARTTAAASGGGGGTTATQTVRSIRVGDVETTFSDSSSTGGGSTSTSTRIAFTGTNYPATPYGQRYLMLLRRSFPAVAIV